MYNFSRLVDIVQFLARSNASEDEMVIALMKFCIRAKLEDYLVYTQITREFNVS